MTGVQASCFYLPDFQTGKGIGLLGAIVLIIEIIDMGWEAPPKPWPLVAVPVLAHGPDAPRHRHPLLFGHQPKAGPVLEIQVRAIVVIFIWTVSDLTQQMEPFFLKAPTARSSFLWWDFQSNRKKSACLPAPQMVQSVRKLEDMPKRFPTKINKSITKAINGPDTYQGHGCNTDSIFLYFQLFPKIGIVRFRLCNFGYMPNPSTF